MLFVPTTDEEMRERFVVAIFLKCWLVESNESKEEECREQKYLSGNYGNVF